LSNLALDNAAELRDFLFTLIESLPSGILLADEQGQLSALNQKAIQILDLANVSVLGRPCLEVLQQGIGVDLNTLAKLKKHGSRIVCEVSAKNGGNENRTIAISRHALKSPFLNVAGMLLSIEDVTHLSLLEARLERQQKFTALQDVAVNLTQELKNPLGSLELFVSMLKRDLAGDEDNERVLSQMVLAIRSMDHLLDNYVTMARQPSAGSGSVLITEWLEQTAEQLRILAPREGSVIQCVFSHADDTISGDLKLLHQMALNLGLNGLESMGEGGTLEISTNEVPAAEGQPAFLQVTFTDQGCGVPTALREKVFDPFFSTKDRAHGLGLAIVHHVVSAHDGLVQLNARPGGGSIFTVLLPRGGPVNG